MLRLSWTEGELVWARLPHAGGATESFGRKEEGTPYRVLHLQDSEEKDRFWNICPKSSVKHQSVGKWGKVATLPRVKVELRS